MTIRAFIEAVRRQIYGGQPPSEASVTIGLVKNYLPDAIGMAAQACYKNSLQFDGIAYINNSFYQTFKGLEVVEDEQFIWRVDLPHIPFGIGTSEGISTLILKDNESRQLTFPFIWLSENQRTVFRGMRAIPNKILAYSQSDSVYILSTLTLSDYTAQATMVSGGDMDDLSNELNVPADYIPIMRDYLFQKFMLQRMQPQDVLNDGSDIIKSA